MTIHLSVSSSRIPKLQGLLELYAKGPQLVTADLEMTSFVLLMKTVHPYQNDDVKSSFN